MTSMYIEQAYLRAGWAMEYRVQALDLDNAPECDPQVIAWWKSAFAWARMAADLEEGAHCEVCGVLTSFAVCTECIEADRESIREHEQAHGPEVLG
jgi:hypothetical protein